MIQAGDAGAAAAAAAGGGAEMAMQLSSGAVCVIHRRLLYRSRKWMLMTCLRQRNLGLDPILQPKGSHIKR